MKKLLSYFMSVVLIISSSAMAFGQSTDYESIWAEKEISYIKEKGIISGYPDGTFRPSNNMSKAEFFKVVNHLMGYTNKVEDGSLDIDDSAWYYEEIQKGLGAKYISSGNILNANEKITRGEIARILGSIFYIEEDDETANEFSDSITFPKEIKGVIGGLKKNGYINGYPDGTYRPKSEITRAEVVKIIYNIAGEIVNEAGTISKDIKTNLIVNTGDVVLKDMIIDGNLYLTEGIGEGDLTLDNVEVKGSLNINGGGANSVIIKDSKLNTVSIEKSLGLVRIVFVNSTAEEIKTAKEVKIQLSDGTIIKAIELDGKVEVIVEKGSAIVTVDALSNEIIIESEGTVESIKTTADIKINGQIVKANTEHKIDEGKATEKKPTPDPIPGPIPSPDPTPDPTPDLVQHQGQIHIQA